MKLSYTQQNNDFSQEKFVIYNGSIIKKKEDFYGPALRIKKARNL